MQRALWLSFACFVASALAACSQVAPAPPPQRQAIRYGVTPTISNSAVYVPAETGAFAAQGLDVSVSPFDDSTQIMLAVGTSQLSMGTITAGPAALNALNRGLDLKILASMTQDPPGHRATSPALVRADLYDSGVLTTPAQLKGHKVGISGRGNVAEYQMAKLLQRGGLSLSDVELVNVPQSDMPAAFANKSIDAADLPEPAATRLVTSGIARFLAEEYLPNFQIGMVVVNTSFAEQHRDAVEGFLRVFLETARKFDDGGIKRDDQALAVIEKYTQVPAETTRQIGDIYWPKDGRLIVDSLNDQQSYYLRNGLVDYQQPVALDRYIDYSYLDHALQRIGN